MRKTVTLPAIILALVILLTGCGDSIEIKERIIVQALGFDYRDGKYIVTLQYFFLQSAGGQTDLGTSDSNSRTVSGSGDTVTAAVRQIASCQGKQVFYGKNNIIIFGESVDRERFESAIDYLVHDYKGRGHNLIFAAEGAAADILRVEISGSLVPAQTIEDTAESTRKLGICPTLRFIDLQNSLYGRAGAAALPVIRVNANIDPSDKKPESIYISGMRVYKNFSRVGELDDGCAKALLMLEGEYDRGAITCKLDGVGSVTAILESFESGYRVSLDPLKITLHAEATGDVKEMERPVYDELTDEQLRELERQAEQQLESLFDMFFDTVLRRYGADVFGLCNRIYAVNPAAYNENGAEQSLSGAEIEYDISVSLVRTELRGGIATF